MCQSFNSKLRTIAVLVGMLLFLCPNMKADNSPWSFRLSIDPLHTTFTHNSGCLGMSFEPRYSLLNELHMGFGVGILETYRFNTAPRVPVFIGFHGDDYSSDVSSTYDLETGFMISTGNGTRTSYFINPQWGFRAFNVGFAVGYVGGLPLDSKGAKRWYNGLNIRLSYIFGK